MKLKQFLRPLAVLGICLCIFAAVSMLTLPEYCQYSFAPSVSQKTITDTFKEVSGTVTGVSYSVSIGGVSGVTVFMYGKDPDSIVPIPVTDGNGFGLSDSENKDAVCVPDEKLAFALFGNTSPIGQAISIGGKSYTVTGTAQFKRTAGDTDSYALWIPFGSNEAITPDLITITGNGLDENELTGLLPGGTFTNIAKEKLRALILPGFMLMTVVLTLLVHCFRLLQNMLRRLTEGFKLRSKTMYAGKNLLHSAPAAAALLLCICAAIAFCYLLLKVIVSPVYVFTEWVPDDLVSLTSITQRFRELCAANAAPVKYVTREYACVRFYAGLLRWGSILIAVSVLNGFIRGRLSD